MIGVSGPLRSWRWHLSEYRPSPQTGAMCVESSSWVLGAPTVELSNCSFEGNEVGQDS
jgi:hypothetical protein